MSKELVKAIVYCLQEMPYEHLQYEGLARWLVANLAAEGYGIVPITPTIEMIRAVDGEDSDKFVARGRAVSAYYIMVGEAMKGFDNPNELP